MDADVGLTSLSKSKAEKGDNPVLRDYVEIKNCELLAQEVEEQKAKVISQKNQIRTIADAGEAAVAELERKLETAEFKLENERSEVITLTNRLKEKEDLEGEALADMENALETLETEHKDTITLLQAQHAEQLQALRDSTGTKEISFETAEEEVKARMEAAASRIQAGVNGAKGRGDTENLQKSTSDEIDAIAAPCDERENDSCKEGDSTGDATSTCNRVTGFKVDKNSENKNIQRESQRIEDSMNTRGVDTGVIQEQEQAQEEEQEQKPLTRGDASSSVHEIGAVSNVVIKEPSAADLYKSYAKDAKLHGRAAGDGGYMDEVEPNVAVEGEQQRQQQRQQQQQQPTTGDAKNSVEDLNAVSDKLPNESIDNTRNGHVAPVCPPVHQSVPEIPSVEQVVPVVPTVQVVQVVQVVPVVPPMVLEIEKQPVEDRDSSINEIASIVTSEISDAKFLLKKEKAALYQLHGLRSSTPLSPQVDFVADKAEWPHEPLGSPRTVEWMSDIKKELDEAKCVPFLLSFIRFIDLYNILVTTWHASLRTLFGLPGELFLLNQRH